MVIQPKIYYNIITHKMHYFFRSIYIFLLFNLYAKQKGTSAVTEVPCINSIRSSEIFDQIGADAVKVMIGETKVHLLVTPGASADAVLFKNGINVSVPCYSILRRYLVDYSELSAV